MSYLIKHRVCFYLDSNSKNFYLTRDITRQLHNINKDTHIPFVYKEIPFTSTVKAELSDLAPLDHDLNIVLLPHKYHVVHLDVQAQHIVLQMSFGRKEKGSYCTFTQRLRHYLRGEPLDARWKTLYSYGTPYTKLIDISTMMDIVDIKMFTILREQIKKLRISVKDRSTLLYTLSLKELLLKRSCTLTQMQERNHSINFYGTQYDPISLRSKDDSVMS